MTATFFNFVASEMGTFFVISVKYPKNSTCKTNRWDKKNIALTIVMITCAVSNVSSMQRLFKLYFYSRDTFWDSKNGNGEERKATTTKGNYDWKLVTLQFHFIFWSMESGIGTNFSLGVGPLFVSKVIHSIGVCWKQVPHNETSNNNKIKREKKSCSKTQRHAHDKGNESIRQFGQNDVNKAANR